MDFLEAGRAKVAGLFGTLGTSARWGIALAVVALIAGAWSLNSAATPGPDSYLLEGVALSPSQLPAMEAAFGKAGLNDYQIEGHRIRIPHSKNAQYLTALTTAGALPPNFGSIMEAALKQTSPLATRSQQEETIKAARQNELALIIQSMKGIETAAVFYDVEKLSGLHAGQRVTASVMVKPADGQSLEIEQIESLRMLLAGAIAGLEPRNVTVTDLGSGRTYSPGADNAAGGAENYAATKREFERLWTEKLRQSLAMIPHAIVTVNCEFDPAGLTGTSMTGSTSVDHNVTQAAYVSPAATGSAVHQVFKVPLRPLQATVSVGIPSSYVDQVWQQRHPTTTDSPLAAWDAQATRTMETQLAALQSEIIANVQSHVRNLLPAGLGPQDPRTKVAVTIFPDIAARAAHAEPDHWTQLSEWGMQHLGLLAPCAAAIVGCMFFIAVNRRRTASDLRPVHSAASHVAHARADDGHATSGSENSNRSLVHDISSGEIAMTTEPTAASLQPAANVASNEDGGLALRDNLANIVRDDPRGAARVLRHWIGTAT
ncbi:MAG: hypothetical protein K8T25_06190 [Planctomycetia bacterium]|nr:hypothetical protein [Planctomycetia bacterium]